MQDRFLICWTPLHFLSHARAVCTRRTFCGSSNTRLDGEEEPSQAKLLRERRGDNQRRCCGACLPSFASCTFRAFFKAADALCIPSSPHWSRSRRQHKMSLDSNSTRFDSWFVFFRAKCWVESRKVVAVERGLRGCDAAEEGKRPRLLSLGAIDIISHVVWDSGGVRVREGIKTTLVLGGVFGLQDADRLFATVWSGWCR